MIVRDDISGSLSSSGLTKVSSSFTSFSWDISLSETYYFFRHYLACVVLKTTWQHVLFSSRTTSRYRITQILPWEIQQTWNCQVYMLNSMNDFGEGSFPCRYAGPQIWEVFLDQGYKKFSWWHPLRARGRIETLAGAYFGHWYLSYNVISSFPRLLTTVGVWEAHLQHVLGVCSYLLHSAAMDCDRAPCNRLLIF